MSTMHKKGKLAQYRLQYMGQILIIGAGKECYSKNNCQVGAYGIG
jgi:hypothetical protein